MHPIRYYLIIPDLIKVVATLENQTKPKRISGCENIVFIISFVFFFFRSLFVFFLHASFTWSNLPGPALVLAEDNRETICHLVEGNFVFLCKNGVMITLWHVGRRLEKISLHVTPVHVMQIPSPCGENMEPLRSWFLLDY